MKKRMLNGQMLPVFDESKSKSDPKESVIEEKIRKYAISKGCYVRKFTSPSQRSVPDRIIITPYGVVGFLEIKRKGKKPTKQQAEELTLLREHECIADFVDSFEAGKHFVDKLLSAHSI